MGFVEGEWVAESLGATAVYYTSALRDDAERLLVIEAVADLAFQVGVGF